MPIAEPLRPVTYHPHAHCAEYRCRPSGFEGHAEHRECGQEYSCGCQHRPVLLCALKNVAHGLGVPLPTASRRDTSGVQRLRDVPQGSCARLLCLADDWKDVRRIPVRFSLDHRNGILAGHVEPWVAEGDTTGPRSLMGPSLRSSGPCQNHCPTHGGNSPYTARR
jgi:hypothetical protein